MNLNDQRLYLWLPALLAAALVMALLLASPALAAPPEQGATVGDCFGGALSEDPLHCHALQQAHNAGIIDVEAIYTAGGSLVMFLSQDGSVGQETHRYIWARAQEAQRTGDHRHRCVLDTDHACDSGMFWVDGAGYALPKSQVYDDIELAPGGREARRAYSGWQVFREVWPEAARDSRETRSAGNARSFDVSDVDTVNIPLLDCHKTFSKTRNGRTEFIAHVVDDDTCNMVQAIRATPAPTRRRPCSNDDTCNMVQAIPDLGIAGWNYGWTKLYVTVKAPAGEETNLAAIKRRVIARNPQGLNDDNVEVIPVSYGFGDLWRSFIVLNRFADSSGNTVGIQSANIYRNWENYDGESVFPSPSIPEVGYTEGGYRIPSQERTTIHLFTHDLDRTVAALPTLLPQLGLKEETVGVVIQVVRTRPERSIPAVLQPPEGLTNLFAGSTDGAGEQGGGFLAGSGPLPTAIWPWVVIVVLAGSAATGTAGLVYFRRRRARRQP